MRDANRPETANINILSSAVPEVNWESQMQVVDSTTGGVRTWLHGQAREFERMVNFANPLRSS